MVQRRARAGFKFQAMHQVGIVRHLRRQHLDCDPALHACVAGKIDLAHAATVQEPVDHVMPDAIFFLENESGNFRHKALDGRLIQHLVFRTIG